MARINFEIKSETLGKSTNTLIFIPDSLIRSEAVNKSAVLYLLHGKTDNEKAWDENTRACEYGDKYGVIMIMPYAENSFYTNMANGDKYWDYISREVPKAMAGTFNISEDRRNNFICGYSMGGYGALKLGLRLPERFAAAATLSGSLRSIEDTREKIKAGDRQDLERVFGECGEDIRIENDIYYLTEKLTAEGRKPPKIYMYCGRGDGLYEFNKRYRDFALEKGITLEYAEDNGGHSFSNWDEQLERFLKYITTEEIA